MANSKMGVQGVGAKGGAFWNTDCYRFAYCAIAGTHYTASVQCACLVSLIEVEPFALDSMRR